MDISDYVRGTSNTAVFPSAIPGQAHTNLVGLLYCAVKLCGEAGEVSEEIGKALRDDQGQISAERHHKICKELGDLSWYWAQMHVLLGLDPSTTLQQNLDKLQDRKDRGAIHGSGSDR